MADLFYTPRYDGDLVAIYKYSKKRWGSIVATRTIEQISNVEQLALSDPQFGRIDAAYHSPIYHYATTANSQTVFFHRLGTDVVMIAAGYQGRGWNFILNDIAPEIQAFIDQVKTD